jgi:hypothetical protein
VLIDPTSANTAASDLRITFNPLGRISTARANVTTITLGLAHATSDHNQIDGLFDDRLLVSKLYAAACRFGHRPAWTSVVLEHQRRSP